MARTSTYNPGTRGEYADRPSDIPPPGWRQVLLRVKDEISGDNLSLVAAGVAFLVALAVIAAVPAAVDFLGVEGWPRAGLLLLRWVGLAAFVLIALAILFRYGPSRAAARFRWITPGAVVATILWIVGSVAFSFYVQSFASYNKTFGSLGAVVVLLMWFYLTAFIVCLGAELNAELEHQTARHSTTGRKRPLGNRGAYVADHTASSDA